MTVSILTGDCRVVLKTLPASSVDSCVTDPPYHLTSIVKRFGAANAAPAKVKETGVYARSSAGFMGQTWDGGDVAFRPETWVEVLRVLKPGGHLLAFGGTRTYHRLVCAIEDAGFEIRDQIQWIFGSGFPKSHDVSKGIDKASGAEREVIGVNAYASRRPQKEYEHAQKWGSTLGGSDTALVSAPATDAARQWEGWGTALKPAHEPIVLARKPLIGTVAANVLAHGTGAMNIDGCRVGDDGGGTQCNNRDENGKCRGHQNAGRSTSGETFHGPDSQGGRWPANVIHDGSDEVLAGFPETKSGSRKGEYAVGTFTARGTVSKELEGSEGSAARFFYCAKASKADRDDGLLGKNNHPTVKPTDLMRYLCRLITPLGGTVLDPFMGSGSTLKAARIEQFSFIGIDLDPAYAEMARARADADAPLFAEAVA